MEQDFPTIARISRALWTDAPYADRVTLDTMAAVSLVEISEDLRLERITKGLLERAMRGGHAGNARQNLLAMDVPFFRLAPQERLILVALHSGRWSYARLSRILSRSTEEIQELAWGARLKLSVGQYPVGAKILSSNCPEYQASRPWTQKFLDDELDSPRERVFLPNHLMACVSCSQALKRCRDLYFSVDGQIAKLLGISESEITGALQRLSRLERPEPLKVDLSFRGSVRVFFGQWDVLAVSALLIIGALSLLWKYLHF